MRGWVFSSNNIKAVLEFRLLLVEGLLEGLGLPEGLELAIDRKFDTIQYY